jgi:hypothetical protein
MKNWSCHETGVEDNCSFRLLDDRYDLTKMCVFVVR